MPALFAYLIAIGLLLGGGYGALSWLAAPEPVKISAKAKLKSQPRYEASSEAMPHEASSPDSGSLATNGGDHATSASNDRPPPSHPQPGAAKDAQGPVDLESRSAKAEASSAEAKREIQRPPEPMPARPPHPQTAAPAAPVTVAKAIKPPHVRPAKNHSEKPAERRALALMTLRTIEFPDGHRVTQLIPYRGPQRALAFDE